MKKFYSLLLLAFVAIAANAQILYLLPGTQDVATTAVTNAYDYLPLEDGGAKYKAPERLAYDWFKGKYGDNKFITIKDVKDGKLTPSVARVLWVNVDRVGLALEGDEGFDAKFTTPLKDALATYVKAGGNVYLTKQATRLSKEMGRATWWPNDYKSNEYAEGSDAWYLQTQFSTGNNINHVIFKGLRTQDTDGNYTSNTFALIDSETHPYQRTDNNCAWGDWSIYAENTGETDAARRSGFENTQTCKILGGWGHTEALQYAGMVEFYPTGDWKGTVIAQGLAAYQWSETNKYESNVEKLTENTLNYLQGEAHWLEGEAPKNGYVNDSYTCTPLSNFEGYNIVLSTTDSEVASFDGGTLTLNKVGNVTVKATYTGDGINSCKTELVLSNDITVQDNWKKEGTHDVTVDRGFTANTRSTICLPFALNKTQCQDLGQFYEFSAADNNGLYFSSVTSTEANKPYLFIPSVNLTAPVKFENVNVVENVAESVAFGDYTFTGVYKTKALENAETNGYYAYTTSGDFATTTGTITVNPTRCYMQYTGSADASHLAKMHVTFDDETVTSINDVNANGSTSANAPIYSISGVRVSKATKGVFIQNGKKFVK